MGSQWQQQPPGPTAAEGPPGAQPTRPARRGVPGARKRQEGPAPQITGRPPAPRRLQTQARAQAGPSACLGPGHRGSWQGAGRWPDDELTARQAQPRTRPTKGWITAGSGSYLPRLPSPWWLSGWGEAQPHDPDPRHPMTPNPLASTRNTLSSWLWNVLRRRSATSMLGGPDSRSRPEPSKGASPAPCCPSCRWRAERWAKLNQGVVAEGPPCEPARCACRSRGNWPSRGAGVKMHPAGA